MGSGVGEIVVYSKRTLHELAHLLKWELSVIFPTGRFEVYFDVVRDGEVTRGNFMQIQTRTPIAFRVIFLGLSFLI